MLKEFIKQEYFQNSLTDYFISLAVVLIGILIVRIFKVIVLRRLRKVAEKSETTIDDFLIRIIEKAGVPLLYFGALYLAVQSLTLDASINKTIDVVGIALVTILTIRSLIEFLLWTLETYWLKKDDTKIQQRSFKGIVVVLKVLIWGAGITFLLDNLGFEITTVIAGLGIGGIAIALASQAILGDLFSYFSILFDRPFEEGDYIIIDDFNGTVEHIGIKTTRVRSSVSGELVVIPNSNLTNSLLRNYKKIDNRRANLSIGVPYQTKAEQLKKIPNMIKRIIEDNDNAIFDRAHFDSFGDYSLNFQIVFYVKGNDYVDFMDTKQKINIAIYEEFEKEGIEFAYPTQTIYLNKEE